MTNKLIAKSLPHFVAILLFSILSFFTFLPVLEGKQLIGHDTESWMCMAKETIDFNKTHSEPTLWTESMFGGMPTYQISMTQPYNLIKYVEDVIHLYPNTIYNLMLYLVGFYILLLAFRQSPWLAIAGALAFAFASYNFIIIAAGHNSKAITIAYMAPLIGSVWLAFRHKKLEGGLLTALFLSLAIRANHVQILYYTLIVLLFLFVVELIYSIKQKEIKSFLQSSAILLVAALIAVGMNATSLLTTYEYGKYTMRGDSNGLTADTQNSQHGLNKDYITQWSYGVGESFTLLIPNFKGGASGGTLGVESETAKKIESFGVSNVAGMMKQMQLPLYWGDQPMTSGPVYIGAIVCFLFVLGLFILDWRTKWWLLPVIVLTLMLSWGKNFMWLTDLFINYVPMYNKFRTVSMNLVATGFAITLIAVLALQKVLSGETDSKQLLRYVLISAGITGGISLIFALIPSSAGNFVSPSDAQFQGDYKFLKDTLPLDRASLLRSDAFRSLAFIVLSAGVIWLYVKGILKQNVFLIVFGLLFLFDLLPVTKRYLNENNFQRQRKLETLLQPSAADEFVLQDKTHYRVLDATVNLFNDASPSYFHKNIGGYHAAKLRRYQELINMQLDKEIGMLFANLNHATSQDQIDATLDTMRVLNMLNMKYIIYSKEATPIVNRMANGNAWFVNKVHVAANANEEMAVLGTIDTKSEIVVDKAFASIIPQKLFSDSTARVVLTKYEPNRMVYSFSSMTDQLAVFSEIYYPDGWNAYVKGVKMPYFRANYLLRAMPLKAGVYEVEFKFEPQSYSLGNTIALVSSILLILAVVSYFFYQWRKKKSILAVVSE